MGRSFHRRTFLASMSLAPLVSSARSAPTVVKSASKPALLGGAPVRTEPFPGWPRWSPEREGQALQKVLDSGQWGRLDGHQVDAFEKNWGEALGVPYVVATNCGTSALSTCLNALEIGPGDEVIVPPYTFVATISVVLGQFALPVFVDTDPNTFQIDSNKIEASLNSNTRALMPVHLGGGCANLDDILALSRKRTIPVIEDACQSHLSEWRGKKAGTLGLGGCFSFQSSKNLNCGEGGAITSSDPQFVAACRSYHNSGRPYEMSSDGTITTRSGVGFSYERNGSNVRPTEFQGAILNAQLRQLEGNARRREDRAAYLTSLLDSIEGLDPVRPYSGCSRNAYHIYMMRYRPESFAGLSRGQFLRALRAEGIPGSSGYPPLNAEPFLKRSLESRAFRKVYSKQRIRSYWERIQCPANDRVCREAVWFGQTTLLGSRGDMDQIAEAVRKIQRHAETLASS